MLRGGRYTTMGVLGSGGMGTVSLARSNGSAGFSRLVAMKRLHPHLAAQKELVAMLVDEARLTSSLSHANVLSARDLVVDEDGFGIVLDYVEGAALDVLWREASQRPSGVPRAVALAIVSGVLRGLDFVHDARGSEGQPLGIVHRDVSPSNILVGLDGVPRIIDFGIAKALGRVGLTRPGELRGKFSYMAPEQMRCHPVTRQADVYAVGVILYELLTGARLFFEADDRDIDTMAGDGGARPPREIDPSIPPALEAIVMRALAADLSERYLSAGEMLVDLAPFERAAEEEVGAWVRSLAAEQLLERAALIQESSWSNPAASRPADDPVRSVKMRARPEPPRLSPLAEPHPALLPPSYLEVAPPPIRTAVDPRFGAVFTFGMASLVISVSLVVGAIRRPMPSPPPGVRTVTTSQTPTTALRATESRAVRRR